MRLTKNPIQNSRNVAPLVAKLVNNGLPLLLTKFINSRRQGISPRTIQFYEYCLEPFVNRYELTSESINQFLSELSCGNAKHAYFRALRAFCNWATREGCIKNNPISKVDPPKPNEPVLPSLTLEQVNYLIKRADNLRDKCIVSLFVNNAGRVGS